MSVVNNSSSCETPATSTYSGTTPFTSLVNSTIYINGYDIRITKVNNNGSGEGLLYFPYLGRRIPVEWNGNTIVKGEGEYGCITSGIVQAQGSDASILTNDLQRQIAALYNNLNEPGSYSGTFGQAIEAMKTKAQVLLDKISHGDPISPEDYKGYRSICKAIDKGLKAWKTQLDEQYGGASSDVPAIKQLYNDIATVQTDILKDVDCDGTGYRPALRQETDLFYASLEPPKTPIRIPDLGGFLLTKCDLELGKANALKLSSLLASESVLTKNSKIEIPSSITMLKLVGKTLITSYTYNNITTEYTYGFKQDVSVSLTNGELTVNGINYVPIRNKSTGAFIGFYQKNYIPQNNELPEGPTIKIGEKLPVTEYKNAYLKPELYILIVNEPKSLSAIDNENNKRIANENEVLYIVRQPSSSRQVNYQWNSSISSEDIQVSLLLLGDQTIYPKINNNSSSYTYNGGPYSATFSLSSFNINKSVITTLVNPDKNSKGLSRELEIIQKGNELIDFFTKKLGLPKYREKQDFLSDKGFRILFNPKVGNIEFENKEDKESRFYFHELVHKNTLEFGIKGEKDIIVPETGFETDINIGCPIHIGLGLYLTPSANALGEIGISQTQQTYVENAKPESLSDPEMLGEFKVDMGLKLGPKLEFNACDGAKVGVSGTVGASAILLQIKKPDAGENDWITSPLLKKGLTLSGEFKWWLEVSGVFKFERSILKSVDTYDFF